MQLRNAIDECSDGRTRDIALRLRRALIIHRSGMGETAADISQAFQDREGEAGRCTGWQMPYTFVIRKDGTIEQALRVGDYGPHARAWNVTAIGLALVGDFRQHPATPEQWQALVDFCTLTCSWLGGVSTIFGHDEVQGGRKDRAKECPGEYLDLAYLRDEVTAGYRYALDSAGVVF